MSEQVPIQKPLPPLSVAVLLGGWSAERQISCASGRAVIRALRELGHDVCQMDPAEMDFWSYPWAGVDVAFIALHGTFGEDGTVQSWLEELRIPYTGSDPTASRLAMQKTAAKQRWRHSSLPTPNYRSGHVSEPHRKLAQKAAAVGYPLVVKPNAQGSSVGVSIVHEPSDLAAALERAFSYDPVVLLEEYVAGREMTVAVLDDQALPPIEIRPARPFYDFQAKYDDADTRYVLEPELPPSAIRRLVSAAAAAVKTLGCCGITRVDLRLDRQHRPWILEVNSIPGLTDHSLVPKAAAHVGLTMSHLCELALRAALATHRPKVSAQAA